MGRIVKAQGHIVAAEVLSARDEIARRLADVGRIEEEARARGFAAGHAQGQETARAEATALIAAARADADAVRRANKDAALALARKMAERIIGHAAALDPHTVAHIIEQALAASRATSGRVTVRVHPEDLALIGPRTTSLSAHTGLDLRFVADETVGRTGCVVETPVGRLDARLDAQLDALERAVAAHLPR